MTVGIPTFVRRNEVRIYRCDSGPQCPLPGPQPGLPGAGPRRGGGKGALLRVCPAPGEISLSWFCLPDCVTQRSGGEEITARTKGWCRCVLMQTVSVGPVLD